MPAQGNALGYAETPKGAVLGRPRWGSNRSLGNETQAMPGAILELPRWGVGQNKNECRIFRVKPPVLKVQQ